MRRTFVENWMKKMENVVTWEERQKLVRIGRERGLTGEDDDVENAMLCKLVKEFLAKHA